MLRLRNRKKMKIYNHQRKDIKRTFEILGNSYDPLTAFCLLFISNLIWLAALNNHFDLSLNMDLLPEGNELQMITRGAYSFVLFYFIQVWIFMLYHEKDFWYAVTVLFKPKGSVIQSAFVKNPDRPIRIIEYPLIFDITEVELSDVDVQISSNISDPSFVSRKTPVEREELPAFTSYRWNVRNILRLISYLGAFGSVVVRYK
uniref:Uncharacterized protein n=2 Tax=Chromera velia TaxID=505693 RepID=D9IXI6_9ALVE|nr:hypothetical protein CHVEC_pgp061 [Chromera velia]ADJ66514.2 hypothetical protein [Chromera velia]